MNWRPYIPHALGAAAGICLIGFIVQTVQRGSVQRALVQSRATAKAAIAHDDSVAKVNAAQLGRIVSLTRSGALSDSMATLWRRRAQTAERVLTQLRIDGDRLSDSLRHITTGADSLPVLVRLVATLTTETTTLRQSLSQALIADSARKLAVDSLTAGLDSSAARYELVFTSNAQLRGALERAQKALARAEAPCRILFWGCPSRTSVAVLGAGIGAGVTYAVVAR